MTDPIEDAAREIVDLVSDLDISRSWEGDRPPIPNCEQIADILRKHFPAWKDRPDQTGTWIRMRNHGRKELVMVYAVDEIDSGCDWYGPIPEIPKGGE